MAIYHCEVKLLKRSDGKSSVASAAYRAGEKILDERLGKLFDYTKKTSIAYSEVILPAGAPAVLQKRAELWNTVEKIERRKDAQLSREFEIALPLELSTDQRRELARDFARSFAEKDGIAVDLSIHEKNDNPHAHLMTTLRRVTADGLSAKKDRSLNDKTKIVEWRRRWETMCNAALERAQIAERVSSKSLKDQGIKRLPQVHLGVAAAAMERRGIRTHRGDRNRVIQLLNLERLTTLLKQRLDRVLQVISSREQTKQPEQQSTRLTREEINAMRAQDRQRIADMFKELQTQQEQQQRQTPQLQQQQQQQQQQRQRGGKGVLGGGIGSMG